MASGDVRWFQNFRMCDSKATYSTYAMALDSALKLDIFVYQCPKCKNYHLTSSKRAAPSLNGALSRERKQAEQVIRERRRREKEAALAEERAKKKELKQRRKQYLEGYTPLQEYQRQKCSF